MEVPARVAHEIRDLTTSARMLRQNGLLPASEEKHY
jgi:hypothetical protein